MSAAEVIEEINRLPAADQARVIEFGLKLARTRPLTAAELTALAERMVESNDPAEVERLKTSLTQGFYGGQ